MLLGKLRFRDSPQANFRCLLRLPQVAGITCRFRLLPQITLPPDLQLSLPIGVHTTMNIVAMSSVTITVPEAGAEKPRTSPFELETTIPLRYTPEAPIADSDPAIPSGSFDPWPGVNFEEIAKAAFSQRG